MRVDAKAKTYYATNDHEALFQLVEKSWPKGGGRLPDGIAEACRYAWIRAHQLRRADHPVWRARAWAAAVLTGGAEAAAGLILAEFFLATALALEEKGARRTQYHEAARAVLEEMRRLVPEGTAAWKRLYGRLYHEKRALSFLIQATAAGRPRPGMRSLLEASRKELELAQPFVTDEREKLKVAGGVLLVEYLSLAYAGAKTRIEARKRLSKATLEITVLATNARALDVAKWAKRNAGVMGKGAFTGWTPYEIL